ncbi:hypothetical protein [Streptomyces turgidiscabies]|uniref:Uncharacterized protein n=1 Tax=Streptomyces turgidiscabies TaxID=85558 RepID=A0ABU0RMZ0_9ACTN|nr:hypothetical protein [Streptomyces turgidiscabies]MDQ0933352.1 hypothetical protein [Streptomyces turgidiscabies]
MQEAIIGGLGTIIGALIGAWAAAKARTPSKAKVNFVDATLSVPDNLEPAERAILRGDLPEIILDIKLLNSGGQPAYVHALELTISDVTYDEDMLELPQSWFPQGLRLRLTSRQEPTAFYEVDPYARGLGHPGQSRDVVVSKPLSQEVKPGALERVFLLVPQPSHGRRAPVSFEARVKITYNATRTVEFDKVLRAPLLRHPRWKIVDEIRSHLQSQLAWCEESWSPREQEFLTEDLEQLFPSEQERLRRRRELGLEPGSRRLLKWAGLPTEPRKAVRGYLDSYEQRLRDLADVYSKTDNASSEEAVRLQEAIAVIPRLRGELGVRDATPRPQ